MVPTKLAAGAMSAVLAVSLRPGLALASPLGTGSIADDSTAQALSDSLQRVKTKKMYLVTGVKDVNQTITNLATFKYKDGLMQTAYVRPFANTNANVTADSKLTFKYDGGNKLLKITEWNHNIPGYDELGYIKMKYKDGKLSTATSKYSGIDVKRNYSYVYWADGNLRYENINSYAKLDPKKLTSTSSYKKQSTSQQEFAYYNADGHPGKTSLTMNRVNGASYHTSLLKYHYNAMGDVSTAKIWKYSLNTGSSTLAQALSYQQESYAQKLTYVGSRMMAKKAVQGADNGGLTNANGRAKIRFVYKKIKGIDSADIPVINKQQWALTNHNINRAFGPDTLLTFCF